MVGEGCWRRWQYPGSCCNLSKCCLMLKDEEVVEEMAQPLALEKSVRGEERSEESEVRSEDNDQSDTMQREAEHAESHAAEQQSPSNHKSCKSSSFDEAEEDDQVIEALIYYPEQANRANLRNAKSCPLGSRTGPEGQPAMNSSANETSSDVSSGDSLKICKFSKLGCDFKGNRFEQDLHMDIASERHLEIVCKAILDIKHDYIRKENKVIAKHDAKIKLLQEYICKQNMVIKSLHESNARLEQHAQQEQLRSGEHLERSEALAAQVVALQQRMDNAAVTPPPPPPLAIPETMAAPDIENYSGTLLWRVENIRQCISDAASKTQISILSEPFYSSRYGYKLRAQLFPNGIGAHEGAYMSIYFHVVPSENDDVLSWPFDKKITFALLEQRPLNDLDVGNASPGQQQQDTRAHISYTLVPSAKSASNFGRPREGEMSEGRGHHKFVAIRTVRDEPSQYALRDRIFIKIKVHNCKNSKLGGRGSKSDVD